MMMKKKKNYCKPCTLCVRMENTETLLTISGSTTDPAEGGDPTGGNGSTPNPFSQFGNAKQGLWENVSDDSQTF